MDYWEGVPQAEVLDGSWVGPDSPREGSRMPRRSPVILKQRAVTTHSAGQADPGTADSTSRKRQSREGTKVVQPLFLGKIINYFENYDPSDTVALHEAYGHAAVLSTCVLILAILHHLYFYHVQCAGMRLRVAMCHMIYRKALRLSNVAMGKTTTGQIVNLLSNDVNKFDQMMGTWWARIVLLPEPCTVPAAQAAFDQ
ncbi:ABCC4 protein-like protein [Camelus ferus]|nr:ABCC4 protein-like protein [Camelus ferus]